MSNFPWRQRAAWRCMARVTPWLCSSQEAYFGRLESLIRPGIRILDIGCGKEFLMRWLPARLHSRWSASILGQATIFGVDPHWPSLRANPARLHACAFADRLPFAASTFDLVTANMVVEHLEYPDVVLKEVFRVLRPGGLFLFHTPNLRAPVIRIFHLLPHRLKQLLVPAVEGGRQEEDVFPTHYRMNTREAVAGGAARCGWECVSVEHVFTTPFTQFLGPLVSFELCLVRLFAAERFARWRPDLVCLLRKPARGRTAADGISQPRVTAEAAGGDPGG